MCDDITALGEHVRSNNIGRGITTLPLDRTHGRTTSGVPCHHCPRTARTIGPCRAWHDITALGQHARSNDIKRRMISPPLERTHGRTTSGVASLHCPRTACTVRRPRAWHDFTALGQRTRSNDVGRGVTSPPLDNTHGRSRWAWYAITALGQLTRLNDVGRGMTSRLDDVGRCMTSPP